MASLVSIDSSGYREATLVRLSRYGTPNGKGVGTPVSAAVPLARVVRSRLVPAYGSDASRRWRRPAAGPEECLGPHTCLEGERDHGEGTPRPHRRQHRRLEGSAAARARRRTSWLRGPVRPAGPGRGRARVRCAPRPLRARELQGESTSPTHTRNGRRRESRSRTRWFAQLARSIWCASIRTANAASIPTYSGFLAAWRAKSGDTPGIVCQVGAGGAGRRSRSRWPSLARTRSGSWTSTVIGRGGWRERCGSRTRNWTRRRSRAWKKRRRGRGVSSTALRWAWSATAGRRSRVCSCRGRRGRSTRSIPRSRTQFLADAAAVGVDTLKRGRTLLPPGSGRFRDLLRQIGRSDRAPKGVGRALSSAYRLILRFSGCSRGVGYRTLRVRRL